MHALAWSYLRTGARDQAERVLAFGVEECSDLSGFIRGRATDELHYCAEHALLRGDQERALSTLELAVDLGWLGYYLREFDPYWQQLADEPRYRALMARVRSNVDASRAEIERLDAADDFRARFEAGTLASRSADAAARPTP